MNPTAAYRALQSGDVESLSSARKFSRQQDSIMQLLAQVKTNKEIANQLNISENTVKNYLALIFKKLRVNKRKEAVAQFLRI